MLDKLYYETIDQFEKQGVDRDYIQGWAGGYLGNPKREEQRVSDAYTAGYVDGESRATQNADKFKA